MGQKASKFCHLGHFFEFEVQTWTEKQSFKTCHVMLGIHNIYISKEMVPNSEIGHL